MDYTTYYTKDSMTEKLFNRYEEVTRFFKEFFDRTVTEYVLDDIVDDVPISIYRCRDNIRYCIVTKDKNQDYQFRLFNPKTNHYQKVEKLKGPADIVGDYLIQSELKYVETEEFIAFHMTKVNDRDPKELLDTTSYFGKLSFDEKVKKIFFSSTRNNDHGKDYYITVHSKNDVRVWRIEFDDEYHQIKFIQILDLWDIANVYGVISNSEDTILKIFCNSIEDTGIKKTVHVIKPELR